MIEKNVSGKSEDGCCTFYPSLLEPESRNESSAAIGTYLQTWRYFEHVKHQVRRQFTPFGNTTVQVMTVTVAASDEFLELLLVCWLPVVFLEWCWWMLNLTSLAFTFLKLLFHKIIASSCFSGVVLVDVELNKPCFHLFEVGFSQNYSSFYYFVKCFLFFFCFYFWFCYCLAFSHRKIFPYTEA
jgi:hypothetical protein